MMHRLQLSNPRCFLLLTPLLTWMLGVGCTGEVLRTKSTDPVAESSAAETRDKSSGLDTAPVINTRPPLAPAGSQGEAVVALHAQEHMKARDICRDARPDHQGIGCSDFVTGSLPLRSPIDVYLVVARASPLTGVAGLSCGVATSGNVKVNGWTRCADLDFPSPVWPENGGGNRVTWSPSTNCQKTEIGGDGVHAVVGSFYVYAYEPGILEITDNFVAAERLRVADCSAGESGVSAEAGKIGFGATTEGFNPCK